ncbi:MAG: GldG family protein [Ruminococcus sp.]|jgi:hypothetical protein|nr:GldG family protein [Ruminococcus sp.]
MNDNEKNTEYEAGVTETERRKVNLKKLKYGTLSIIITIIVIAAVVLVNVIVGVLSTQNNLTVDLTADDFYEISPETTEYLKQVTQNIEIAVMVQESALNTSDGSTYGVYYKQAYEIMKKYPQANSRIKLKFVDITLHPEEAARYSAVYQGSIESGAIVTSLLDDAGRPVRVKVNAISDLFNTELNYQTYQYDILSSKAEQVLTTAVIYVTDVKRLKAYLMSVEAAESYTPSNIEQMLKDNGYDVARWNPSEPIPTDMDLLVVDCPLNDFPENIIDQIYNYLENDGKYGKNMVYLANSAQKQTPNINTFLREWGLSLRQGVVIGETDPQKLVTAQSEYWFQTRINTMNADGSASNPYAEGVSNTNLPTVVFAATPIDILFSNQGIVNTVPLLQTSDTAFADTSILDELNGVEPSTTKEQGIYTVMALSYKYSFNDNNEMIKSNVLVLGSSEMLDSTVTSSNNYSNAEYFISTVNVMTGKTSAIIVTAKADDTGTFEVTQERYNVSYMVLMIALPLAVLIIGAVVLLRRRHK